MVAAKSIIGVAGLDIECIAPGVAGDGNCSGNIGNFDDDPLVEDSSADSGIAFRSALGVLTGNPGVLNVVSICFICLIVDGVCTGELGSAGEREAGDREGGDGFNLIYCDAV